MTFPINSKTNRTQLGSVNLLWIKVKNVEFFTLLSIYARTKRGKFY